VRICTFSSVLESHSNLLHLIATHQIEVPVPVCAFATHVNDHLLRVAIGIEAGTDVLTIAGADLNLHLLKSSDVDCLLWLSRSQDDITFGAIEGKARRNAGVMEPCPFYVMGVEDVDGVNAWEITVLRRP
jgi:hypothetical protein